MTQYSSSFNYFNKDTNLSEKQYMSNCLAKAIELEPTSSNYCAYPCLSCIYIYMDTNNTLTRIFF